MPITNLEDNFLVRLNQRAELYAAKLGLKFLVKANGANTKELTGKSKDESKAQIIATNSKYVVKGITKQLLTQKVYSSYPNKGFQTLLTNFVEERLAHV